MNANCSVCKVVWPVITLTAPRSVETYTTEVELRTGFTGAVCAPATRELQGVLQGGELGLPTVWLKLELCMDEKCEESEVRYLDKLPSFYTSPYSSLTVPCRFWGWPGVYRARVGVEHRSTEDWAPQDRIIATSDNIDVTWSLDYKIQVPEDNLRNCVSGDSVVLEVDYPHCIGVQDKVRFFQQPVHPGLGRPQYIAEQRVIPGDKAVLFPCSLFNQSEGFTPCFHYISTAQSGKVALVTDSCAKQNEGIQLSFMATIIDVTFFLNTAFDLIFASTLLQFAFIAVFYFYLLLQYRI